MSQINDNTIALQELLEAALGLPSAGGGVGTLQTKTITPTQADQIVTPDEGYDGFSHVTVEAIPSDYVKPNGVLQITSSGTFDVSNYKTVVVNVPIPDGYISTSDATAIAVDLYEGKTAYAKGIKLTGTNPYAKEETDLTADTQGELMQQILTLLEGKASGGGNAEPEYKSLYQRVEYITSDAASYIITDYAADNACGLEVVASFPTLVDRIPMGSRADSGATRFYCVYPLSASSCYFGFNAGSTISCALGINTKYRLQTNFMNSRLVGIFDDAGTRKGSTSISATLTEQTGPIAIFGYMRGDTGVISSMRAFDLYSVRISQGHEIVREYIPCYRKSDGVIGVYEKHTDQFLTNSGTGAFTKGADIDW